MCVMAQLPTPPARLPDALPPIARASCSIWMPWFFTLFTHRPSTSSSVKRACRYSSNSGTCVQHSRGGGQLSTAEDAYA